MISILELTQQVWVDTPKGRGRLYLVTEYGSEIEKVFTVILDNGEIWEFTNEYIRLRIILRFRGNLNDW